MHRVESGVALVTSQENSIKPLEYGPHVCEIEKLKMNDDLFASASCTDPSVVKKNSLFS